MLFNSPGFVFLFLPASLAIFLFLRRRGLLRASVFALAALSLVFYSWWNPRFLPILLGSILLNFYLARAIGAARRSAPRLARPLLASGVGFNLVVLGYFKYANFLDDNLARFALPHFALAPIALPLGISFFTFQKIAFLVDVHRGRAGEVRLWDYALLMSFYPQLIAGPIMHHSELLPQLDAGSARPRADDLRLGFTIFVLGLAKKVLVADPIAAFADPAFGAVALGGSLDATSAWTAALSYTAQLYFDFSGYSDMAIGLGLLFGIRLPINFNSPYKATSIIDFWRRWHITLSRFLRDYLYVGLGGNRRGTFRRYLNLSITMVLGGLWHGAGWTFLVWGALHGACLIVNHLWRALANGAATSVAGKALSWSVTFLVVVVGWVFFRSAGVGAALRLLQSMAGNGGLNPQTQSGFPTGLCLALVLIAVAAVAPNTQEIVGYQGPRGDFAGEPASPSRSPTWGPTRRWAVAAGLIFAASIGTFSRISQFIYFQF